MKRCQRLSTTLMLLSATALACVAVASAPALAQLAQPQGQSGGNGGGGGHGGGGGPTVVTTDGPVRGMVKNGVNQFLGIPYAAPPIGNLRWKPPAPPAHHALLDATEFANSCPQVTELGAFAGPCDHRRGLSLSQRLHDRDQPEKTGHCLDSRRRKR